MSLDSEIEKLKRLLKTLNELNENTVPKKDILHLLEILKDLLPILIKALKVR